MLIAPDPIVLLLDPLQFDIFINDLRLVSFECLEKRLVVNHPNFLLVHVGEETVFDLGIQLLQLFKVRVPLIHCDKPVLVRVQELEEVEKAHFFQVESLLDISQDKLNLLIVEWLLGIKFGFLNERSG